LPVPTEQVVHGLQEFLYPEGLSEQLHAILFMELPKIDGAHLARDKQEAVGRIGIAARHQSEQALPAQAGHILIANDQIEVLFANALVGLGTGIRNLNLGPMTCQHIVNELGDVDLVVNHEDFLPAQATAESGAGIGLVQRDGEFKR
jgi:hypothetical protein